MAKKVTADSDAKDLDKAYRRALEEITSIKNDVITRMDRLQSGEIQSTWQGNREFNYLGSLLDDIET